jgi:uncharacterized protein (TIGR03086 family)
VESVVAALGVALRAWCGLLDRVEGRQLSLATPDPGWDVADVIAHVIATTRKFTAFADGTTDRPRTSRFVLAEQRTGHRALFAVTAAESLAAWRAVDPRRTCQLPFGAYRAESAAGINLFDLLGHGWDVEQATGLRFACPDEVWAAGFDAARSVIGERRDLRHYAPEIPVGPDAPARIRLLRYLGRSEDQPN